MRQDDGPLYEMLVTDEERIRLEEQRNAAQRLARAWRIVDAIYERLGYGQIVVEEPEEGLVRGDVGYLGLAVSHKVWAAWDPTDTDTERVSAEWPLDSSDDTIIGDLVPALRRAAAHRRLTDSAIEGVQHAAHRPRSVPVRLLAEILGLDASRGVTRFRLINGAELEIPNDVKATLFDQF